MLGSPGRVGPRSRSVWSRVSDTNLLMAWQKEEFIEKHGGVSWVERKGKKYNTSPGSELRWKRKGHPTLGALPFPSQPTTHQTHKGCSLPNPTSKRDDLIGPAVVRGPARVQSGLVRRLGLHSTHTTAGEPCGSGSQ